MPKTKISEFSATPANNTDIDSINIAEGCAPSGINDAIRELMAQLKDFQTGAVGDSFNGPIGTTTAAAGAFTTLSASSTLGVTGVSTLTGGAVVQGLTVGRGAGAVATNTAVGASALATNSSGIQTVAIGANAGQYQTNNNNTAVGFNSLVGVSGSSNGGSNTAVGSNSLAGLTSGNFNTAIGQQALTANTSASGNTAVGYQAGQSNTTGTDNTFVGYVAGKTVITGSYNTVMGYSAFQNGTSSFNSFFGRFAGTGTTGDSNSGFGNGSLNVNTSGAENSAFGTTSLTSNTTGSYNVAVGRQALQANTTASYNTAVGYQAGYTNITGQTVTYLGYQAGYTATGGNNTFVGTQSGYAVTTGAKNTILGRYDGNQGGLDIRTASNHIVLSDGDGNPRGIFDNTGRFLIAQTSASAASAGGKLQVGSDLLSTGSGSGYFWENRSGGVTSTSNWYGWYTSAGTIFLYNGSANIASINSSSGAYTALSDVTKKKDFEDSSIGLSAVMQLKPKLFRMLDDADDTPKQLGFVAQDVKDIIPQAYVEQSVLDAGNNNATYIGLNDRPIIAALTKAIQELKAEFDAYKASHP
jgi:hypothetical protein